MTRFGILAAILGIASLVGCGGGNVVEREAPDPPSTAAGGAVQAAHCADRGALRRLEKAVDAAVDRAMAAHPDVRSALAQVHLPARGLVVRRAVGFADETRRRPALPGTPFRTASVTKTMTAAVILELVGEGKLALGDTLERLEGVIPLDALHVMGGVSSGRLITVEQLLRHRSGLPDYFFDGPRDANGLTEYMRDVLANPEQVREPRALVQWTIDHLEPVAPPGAVYHYADTNYVLLGLLAEAVDAKPLARIYRERVFAPLGMTGSYLEFHEPPRGGRPAHTFYGPLDVTAVRLGEWGGGGVVSTLGDLDRFVLGLVSGRLLRSSPSFDDMLPSDEIAPGFGYGLGIARLSLASAVVYGHDGVFGIWAVYVPAPGASIVLTLNQAAADPWDLLQELVAAAVDAGG